jgi:hypothetical protein
MILPIITLIIAGYLIYNMWKHIQNEIERDKRHEKHHRIHTSNRNVDKRPW